MQAPNYETLSKKELIERLLEAERRLHRAGASTRPDVNRGTAGMEEQNRPAAFARGDVKSASESDCTVLDRDGRVRRLYRVVKDIRDDAGNPVFSEGALYEIGRKQDAEGENPGAPGESDRTELICRFRPNGTLTYVNEAYCRYFGCEREELRNRNILLSISEADREKVYSRLKGLRPESPVDTLEYRVENVFGDVLWNQWTYRALFDDSGNILEYQSVGRDITFRKYTQDVLQKRAAILEAVTFAAEGFLRGASWRDRIERVLERFGAAMNAAHVFLCENQIGADGDIAVRNSYEWRSPEIEDGGARGRLLRDSELAVRFSRWVYGKSEGRPIYGTIGQFPDREVGELALDQKLSIAVVPILNGERWWGFIGFADYSGGIQWTEDEIAPLGTASEILGSAVERGEKERALREALEALRASETRYRELAEHLPVGIYEADFTGRVHYANNAAMEMFGYSAGEVAAGVNFLDVVAPEEREILVRNIKSVREGTPLVCQEYTMVRHDGSRFQALTRARPLIRDGLLVGSTGIVTDISELKRIQEALQKNEALLASILRTAPIGVGTVQGRVLGWVNEGMSALTGYDGHALRGMSTRGLYPDDEEFERAGRNLYGEIAARGNGSVETRWKRSDGSIVDVQVNAAPIDPADPSEGVVFTALDITAQKKAARILLFAKSDLEKQVAEQTRELDVANMLLRIELEEHRKTEEALVKSEQLYRAIVEDQTEIICRVRPDGTISFVNEAFCRYFGKDRSELLGSRYLPPIPREDRKKLWTAYAALTPDRPVFHVEVRIGMPDGTLRWLQWTSRAVFDDSGAVAEHQGVGRDITERIRSEQQIRESRNMLRAVFDGIADPLVMVREDMTVVMLNRAALRFLGASLYRERIGTSCLDFFRARYGAEETNLVQAAVAGQESARHELTTRGDSTRYEEVFVYPVFAGGEGHGMAIIRVTDRTRQRLMERELIQSEKLASLGLLISGIVHEINNPNNFISFNMPILREYIQDILPVLDEHAARTPDYEVLGMPYADFRADLLKLIENIEHGSTRINTTVAKLREFSRKKDEKGARPLLPTKVVERAVSICHTQIRKTVKTFDVQVQPDMPEMVTDPDAIEQPLINLLINAAQAADKPDSRIRLSAGRGADGEGLVLEVEDNGCGMDGRTASRLFDPFFTTKEEGLGTGLGLYISKNLIESVGGSITVESEPGRGTRFRVVLPDLNPPGRREQASEERGVGS